MRKNMCNIYFFFFWVARDRQEVAMEGHESRIHEKRWINEYEMNCEGQVQVSEVGPEEKNGRMCLKSPSRRERSTKGWAKADRRSSNRKWEEGKSWDNGTLWGTVLYKIGYNRSKLPGVSVTSYFMWNMWCDQYAKNSTSFN